MDNIEDNVGEIMMDSFNLCNRMDDAESKCLSCGVPMPEGREMQRKFAGGQMTMLILSDGTDDSKKLLHNASEAIKSSGKLIICEEVTDGEAIAEYHVRKLPALVINGSIVSQGIVSSVDDIISEIEYMY